MSGIKEDAKEAEREAERVKFRLSAEDLLSPANS